MTWTDEEIAEFDALVDKSESRDQVTRIVGRLELRQFVATHGKDKCDAMWSELLKRDDYQKRNNK